jgi:hypothetical protein
VGFVWIGSFFGVLLSGWKRERGEEGSSFNINIVLGKEARIYQKG